MEEQKSAKAGCFVPVDPQFALDYHGNTFSIDGIRIETEDGVNGGLIGCVTGNKKLEFQDCYFVGNIDRRGKTEKQDGGPTISRDWLGNTGDHGRKQEYACCKSGGSAGRGVHV